MNLDELEARGRERVTHNQAIVDEGLPMGGDLRNYAPSDTLDDQDAGISIHDPWKSSCGRFEVDPYKEYGRAFVEWLLLGESL